VLDRTPLEALSRGLYNCYYYYYYYSYTRAGR
jgi:hypothetical protein